MIGWIYFALCELVAAAFFWLPLWWWWLPPIGLSIAVLFCLARAWTSTATAPSIKPLPNRPAVDAWWRPIQLLLGWLIGQPEDGPSGRFAYGPSWTGAYNSTGSTWRAICWQCRNWLDGFNYVTWPWAAAAPNLQLPYTVPAWVPRIGGTARILRLGWQQLPASDGWVGPYRVRMVCSP